MTDEPCETQLVNYAEPGGPRRAGSRARDRRAEDSEIVIRGTDADACPGSPRVGRRHQAASLGLDGVACHTDATEATLQTNYEPPRMWWVL